MRALFVAACSLTLSFGAAIGINMQKLSMTNEEKKLSSSSTTRNNNNNKRQRRPPYKQPLWCLGMAILLLDACGDFVFIGLAPQCLLAPLGSLSLGFNIILAPIFHPATEQVTRNIVMATAIIYAGTITTVLFAPESSPNYNLNKLVGLVTNGSFLFYASACVAFQIGLFYHGSSSSSNKDSGSSSIGSKFNTNGFGIVHYCGLAGAFGGECILFAKSSSELIKNAIMTGQWNDFTTSIIPYMFIVGMITCVLTQVNFLNTGLSKFDALIVVPVYQSFWNAFGITGGLVFFQEYHNMKVFEGFMYAIGVGITLVGVVMLVQERKIGSTSTSSTTVEQQQKRRTGSYGEQQPLLGNNNDKTASSSETTTTRDTNGSTNNNGDAKTTTTTTTPDNTNNCQPLRIRASTSGSEDMDGSIRASLTMRHRRARLPTEELKALM